MIRFFKFYRIFLGEFESNKGNVQRDDNTAYVSIVNDYPKMEINTFNSAPEGVIKW